MQGVNKAAISFSVHWQSPFALHTDRQFIEKVDFWRDLFPGNMAQHLSALEPGERYREHFQAGILVPPFTEKRLVELNGKDFSGHGKPTSTPRLGRFYPQGWFWKDFNCFPQNTKPFRIIGRKGSVLIADTNHPLARYPLTLEAEVVERRHSADQRGGSFNTIGEMITAGGPGMQIPARETATDFYGSYPFARKNEDDDSRFYHTARMVKHLDDTAIKEIESIYSRILRPGSRVLDLMSSWVSHFPESHKHLEVTGLGLNEEELRANRQLTRIIVHDLNKNPLLPLKNNEFDACVCTVSMEYLSKPLEVMTEMARVTKPGGVVIATISDRWFPGKEILPWSEMHPFERFGLILDYFLKTPSLEQVQTESVLGLPRPLTDKHIGKTMLADPVFAVWGTVNSTG